MRILVTGAQGQLGQALASVARAGEGMEWHFQDKAQLDIRDEEQVMSMMRFYQPDVVINTAAYTAVDQAETAQEAAFQLNRDAVGLLARSCASLQAQFIHFSTDYVYDSGQCTPYREEDPLAPRSVYARSKREGEMRALEANPHTMIIRTSWLYGPVRHNFLNTMLRLGAERSSVNVVFDQVGSPTLTTDLAQDLVTILRQTQADPNRKELLRGIFNYSNEGVCSWYDFAEAIFRIQGKACKARPIRSEAYPTPAPRPAYSVMDKAKIRETFGIALSHWQDALRRCLMTYPGF
jgi:dTDP-4-dehydrorhamnose reductase